MKKALLPAFVLLMFILQPENNITSQKKTRADTTNSVLKNEVDKKADSVLKSLDELKVIIDEKQTVKYKTRWRTKIVTIHDTIYQCPPSDSSDFNNDYPDVIYIHDTVVKIKRDTIIGRRKFLSKKVFYHSLNSQK